MCSILAMQHSNPSCQVGYVPKSHILFHITTNDITKHLYAISLDSLTLSLFQHLQLAGFSLLCSSTAFHLCGATQDTVQMQQQELHHPKLNQAECLHRWVLKLQQTASTFCKYLLSKQKLRMMTLSPSIIETF